MMLNSLFNWILVACLGTNLAGLKEILRKWWVILGPEFIRRFCILFILTLILAVIEVAGLMTILPLISTLIVPEQLKANAWGKKLFEISHARNDSELIFLLCSIFFTIFVMRNILSILINYKQYRFAFDCQVSVSSRVLAGYLDHEYEFFLSHNSAVLMKNVTMETSHFATQVIVYSLQLISNLFISTTICLFLILFNPWIALIVALVAFGLFGGIYIGLRRRLVPWARRRDQLYSEMNRIAHQALSGIKEVKVLGCESEYLQQFNLHSAPYGRLYTRYQTVNTTTRFFVELVTAGSAILIIMFCSYFDLVFKVYVPYMAMYFVALNRILPSANYVFSSMVTIRYYWYTVHNVFEALEGGRHKDGLSQSIITAQKLQTELPPMNRSIGFDHVGYRYPGTETNVLNDINIEIHHGARVAVVGSSGAGKTTTIDLLLALLEPTQGVIRIDGEALTVFNRRSWQKQLGYVPQQIFLADASLQENIAFGIRAAEIEPERLREAIRKAQLEKLVSGLPQGVQTPIGERGVQLSGGEQQRIGIARALYRRPRVLILDEATSALDPITESEINKEVLAISEEITVIIITHRLSAVRDCDRLFFLEKGKVAGSGTYDELIKICPTFAEMDRTMKISFNK